MAKYSCVERSLAHTKIAQQLHPGELAHHEGRTAVGRLFRVHKGEWVD